MKEKSWKQIFFNIIGNILLLSLGLVFVLLEHPNRIRLYGFGFLAFISYIPLLFCIKRIKLKEAWFYGLLYGGFYGFFLFNWLKNYDSYGIYAISFHFAIIYLILFISLKIIDILFNNKSWIYDWLFICSFEYLCTKGFMGLGFAVSAYSLWNYTALIQICSLVGVFGLNLLVIFPSCCIYGFVTKAMAKKKIQYERDMDNTFYDCDTHFNYKSVYDIQIKKLNLLVNNICGVSWLVVMAVVCVYGYYVAKPTDKKNTAAGRTVKIAAVQINEDPHEDGIKIYTRNVKKLMNTTESLLELNSDIDIIVWPETAVVPSIVYQYNAQKDENRYKLSKYLLEFMNSKNSVFVIGNGHVVEENGSKNRYNSALVFTPKENCLPPEPEVYSKIHLVPYSECFPMGKHFSKLDSFVRKLEPNMWDKGSELTVFNYKDFYFSTPICFEDNFSDGCRKLYLSGARCFLNLSNDSWSKSDVCQYEHLAMAVFRSVENRIPSVRSTTSGITCVIDQYGRIVEKVPSFSENYLIASVPVIDKDRESTFYSKTGDFCGYATCGIIFLLLLIQIILVIIKKITQNKLAGE